MKFNFEVSQESSLSFTNSTGVDESSVFLRGEQLLNVESAMFRDKWVAYQETHGSVTITYIGVF